MPLKVLHQKEPDACASKRRRSVASASLILFSTVTFASVPTLGATVKAPPISVNGSSISGGALERENTVFVPAKGYFEKLGASVSSSGRSFVAKMHGKELARLSMGSRNVVIGGSTHTLMTAPFMVGGVAMLPLRSISEAAGARVAYVADPRAVAITRSSTAAMPGGSAAAAATVAQAVAPAATTDATATTAPAPADAQSNASSIPWWLWALLALLLIALIIWLLSRRKKEPVITTTGSGRTHDRSDPTITTRK